MLKYEGESLEVEGEKPIFAPESLHWMCERF